jgi:hypothetical protein
MPEMLKDAVIDETGKYRYSLIRHWESWQPKLLFIMLNPSTADANLDDPTIRRCIGFAKAWGFGSLEVVNLFAYRATNPEELKKCKDPIGPENDMHIQRAALQTDKIITAWGTNGTLLGRDRKVMDILYSFRTYCLQMSKNGHPKHPLYIPSSCEPIRYYQEA